MNRRKSDMLKMKVVELETAYLASMFETLIECSDENQRWYYHGARNAARIYSKNLVKKLRKEKVTTNSDEWICRYLNYAIIVLQNAGTLVFKKHKIDRVLFDNHNLRVYKPMTDEELTECRDFFGSSFVDKVTQDEHPVFNAMMDHSKRREELRAKLPGMESMFDAWDREREWLNSEHRSTESNLKVLYAEPYEVEDSLIISESAAKKLNGTVEGLMNYHGVVAGNDIGFGPRMEMDKDGNMRLISVDLCRKSDNNESSIN